MFDSGRIEKNVTIEWSNIGKGSELSMYKSISSNGKINLVNSAKELKYFLLIYVLIKIVIL